MRKRMNKSHQVYPRQSGFTLLISLLVLLALSIVVFAAAKTSFFQEKMAGAEVGLHRNFETAEELVRNRESEIAAMTEANFRALIEDISEVSPEDIVNLTCGIIKIDSADLVGGEAGGVRIETTFYVPPPAINWGCEYGPQKAVCEGREGKIVICHTNNYSNISRAEAVANPSLCEGSQADFGNTNAVGESAWDSNHAHWDHGCDYEGICEETIGGNDCRERFGDVARRLSWAQLWD